MPKVILINADVMEGLAGLPDGSVQCCVTSPPYWGLRDYGTPGQIGLEPTIEEFVAKMVEVFREVKRVLRSDGVCFINLGDSFSSLQSSRKQYIIREDLTEEEVYETALGIWRYLPELWRTCWQEKVQGSLPEMLSNTISVGAPRGKEGGLQEILPETHREIFAADQESPEATAVGNDNGVGREVCLLRGNRADVSVPGSYQDGGQEGIREAGRTPWCLAPSNSGRVAEGQVSSSLLELQCGIRFVRFLSSFRLEIASIPKQLRKFFKPMSTLKPKDLCGIPWRVALALQADGWWLRSDIIWAKPNPMPESCTDRPTTAHEHIFLLTKSAKYFWDAEAVREEAIGQNEHDLTGPGYFAPGQLPQTGRRVKAPDGWASHSGGHGSVHRDGREKGKAAIIRPGRNCRSVWNINSAPFPGSHFATFPPELVRRCVAAGTSERGCCGATVKRLKVRDNLTQEEQIKVEAFLSSKGWL